MEFPFPFPKIGNGIFIPVPVPKSWECNFSFPFPKFGNGLSHSRSRSQMSKDHSRSPLVDLNYILWNTLLDSSWWRTQWMKLTSRASRRESKVSSPHQWDGAGQGGSRRRRWWRGARERTTKAMKPNWPARWTAGAAAHPIGSDWFFARIFLTDQIHMLCCLVVLKQISTEPTSFCGGD